MAVNFEKRRTSAQTVAICDMFGLILQATIFICLLVLALADLLQTHRYSSDIVIVFIVIISPILVPVILLDFFTIKELFAATGGNGNITAWKALCKCHSWINLNGFWLGIKFCVLLIGISQKSIIAFLIGAVVRLYMFLIVYRYKIALIRIRLGNESCDLPTAPIDDFI